MIDQFGPTGQMCLLNANAQCDRIWVSQSDGLRLAHVQTLGQEESILKESDAAVSVRRAQISDSAAYAQCVRGCAGPRL
jgi:threonine dehydrogenase-like Zn-dependent dehydrogenase